MSETDHDAMRELQQRSLRNMRGLLDKLDDEEKQRRRRERRMLYVMIGIPAAFVVAVAVGIAFFPRNPPVTIDASRLPPIQAGPQQR